MKIEIKFVIDVPEIETMTRSHKKKIGKEVEAMLNDWPWDFMFEESAVATEGPWIRQVTEE